MFGHPYNAHDWAGKVRPHGSEFDGKVGSLSMDYGARGCMMFFARSAIGLPQAAFIDYEHIEIIPPMDIEGRIFAKAWNLYTYGDIALQVLHNRAAFYGEDS